MKKNENVPLATEIIRRMFWVIILLIIALVGTNIYWAKKLNESEYEIVAEETTVDTEGDGMATYLENSESGDITNGKNN